MTQTLHQAGVADTVLSKLPAPLRALATCSTDPQDLIQLAELSCGIEKIRWVSLWSTTDSKQGRIRPVA